MLFSIATPTRNSLDKLKRCVGSVRGQHGVAIEHLLQDALSTDGTPAWLADQRDVRGVSEADANMYDAINRAWGRSRGDVLSWLNSDEQYLPGALATVEAYFAANPRVDVVFGDYIVADARGYAVAQRREIPFRRVCVASSFLNALSCTLFFRRRLVARGLLQLDTKFRYAADMELMLRLAAAGAVVRHIPAYLALFGIDGSNLSTHPEAVREAETIGRAHGGFQHRALRQLMLAGRRIERLVRGAYLPRTIRYRYATDEVPHYVEIEAAKLGGSYTLTDTGRADRITAV